MNAKTLNERFEEAYLAGRDRENPMVACLVTKYVGHEEYSNPHTQALFEMFLKGREDGQGGAVMSLDSREQFDAWIMEQASHGVFFGGFTEQEEEGAWAAWQASRAALVVELPAKNPEDHTFLANCDTSAARCDAENDMIDECRAAIEAAGVKVAT